MPARSLTQRLETLQQKKDALDAQIKEIEQQHSRQLRKEKQEKARIIGMAMLRMVERGEWSEAQLFDMVSPFIISGKERRFLGLVPSASNKGTSSKTLVSKKSISSSKATAPATAAVVTTSSDKAVSSAPAKASDRVARAAAKRLPESTAEQDLSNEFNL